LQAGDFFFVSANAALPANFQRSAALLLLVLLPASTSVPESELLLLAVLHAMLLPTERLLAKPMLMLDMKPLLPVVADDNLVPRILGCVEKSCL
jgi:hypothetical protein